MNQLKQPLNLCWKPQTCPLLSIARDGVAEKSAERTFLPGADRCRLAPPHFQRRCWAEGFWRAENSRKEVLVGGRKVSRPKSSAIPDAFLSLARHVRAEAGPTAGRPEIKKLLLKGAPAGPAQTWSIQAASGSRTHVRKGDALSLGTRVDFGRWTRPFVGLSIGV